MAKETCCSMALSEAKGGVRQSLRSESDGGQQAHPTLSAGLPEAMEEFVRDAFANDLQLLAALNDCEPSERLLEALRSALAKDWFAFKITSELVTEACALLDTALDAMPQPISEAALDELAADYAAIYLLHTFRAPPTESPWLDKDRLERQEPMFEIAEWYRRFGLAAQDRQRRSDDHMVLQLQFLAHLFSMPELDMVTSAAEASRFLDQHLLRWIGDFSGRVASRCETPYYCGIVTLTDGYLQAMRDYLADRYNLPRPLPKEAESIQFDIDDGDDDVARYIPGVEPSW